MQIEVSKSDWSTMMSLIDRAVVIIQKNDPTVSEYNVARRLRQTKKSIIRKIEKQNGKTEKS